MINWSKVLGWSIILGVCILWWYCMFMSPLSTALWTFIIAVVLVIGVKLKEETRV